MGTKIYLTALGALFIVCLSIGFYVAYSHVFASGAYSVPDQDIAQTPTLSASAAAPQS
jgi:hypothetical protein